MLHPATTATQVAITTITTEAVITTIEAETLTEVAWATTTATSLQLLVTWAETWEATAPNHQ